ncbi:hypothetical protein B0H66DRAFT_529330 [Apodospora peruviana]|uniref:HypA protein n=1 Tax=Apodospora peruviana TaxID=516989 RepID=A0AAE0IHV5_9PEZI|nr:hypothetical protein B0H66DRAFT_529330 [Apodospora peruviana]
MASPYKINIVPEDTGLWKVPQTEETAKKASELLQEDLEKHHVFFNESGFHNHIPHHILALYGTGADALALQRGYDDNVDYQRPTLPVHSDIVDDLFQGSWDHAQPYLGKEKHYPDFLRFFQREMDNKSWETVLIEYLFKPAGDPAGDDMLARLFSGFLHPLIQLMYGMEWKQPAIVAEGLAQTAVHEANPKGFLLDAEKVAEQNTEKKMPPIVNLLQQIRSDKKLASAAREEDANKLRDGVLGRARDEMVRIAGLVRVKPEELDEKAAEMFEACVYMAASAAVWKHPPKYPKFDFFLMHHVNAAPIFLTINAQPWIPIDIKVRLLEWKIRMDLLQYAGRVVPPLELDKIAAYEPKSAHVSDPKEIIPRLHTFSEDGHAIKLARASLICHDFVANTKKYTNRILSDKLWTKIFHLIVDSIVESPGSNWVRTAGLASAWKDIPDMPAAAAAPDGSKEKKHSKAE